MEAQKAPLPKTENVKVKKNIKKNENLISLRRKARVREDRGSENSALPKTVKSETKSNNKREKKNSLRRKAGEERTGELKSFLCLKL